MVSLSLLVLFYSTGIGLVTAMMADERFVEDTRAGAAVRLFAIADAEKRQNVKL
jgi:hypothetical protein